VIGVLLCDDAAAFSVLFEHWMTACEGVEVLGVAETAEESCALALEHQPTVIVLDHLLRSTTSEQLVPRLRTAAPQARVLLISGMMASDLEQAAATSDVDGYISKASSTETICQAIHKVVARPPRD
jgi:DNA-binding NarL/FixJ family response regulator